MLYLASEHQDERQRQERVHAHAGPELPRVVIPPEPSRTRPPLDDDAARDQARDHVDRQEPPEQDEELPHVRMVDPARVERSGSCRTREGSPRPARPTTSERKDEHDRHERVQSDAGPEEPRVIAPAEDAPP